MLRLSRRRLPAPRYPLGAEGMFAAALKAHVRAIRDDALDLCADRLPALLALATIRRDFAEDEEPTETAWAAALTALLTLLRLRATARASAATAAITTARKAVAARSLADWRKLLLAAYGVDAFGAAPVLGPLLAAWQSGVTDAVGRMVDELIARVRAEIVQAATETRDVRSVAAGVREAAEASQRRAENIARISVAQLVGQLTRARQVAAGLDAYRWVTMEDERVRPTHRVRHGRVFRWSDPGIAPGSEPRCRCWASPILPQVLMATAA